MPPLTSYAEHGARFTYMRRFKEDGIDIKNLMGLNRVVAGRASAPTEPHSHDLLEIHCVARGTQYQVVDGTPYRMRAGDMLVTHPGESHYSGTVQEKRIDYYLAIDMRAEKNRFLGFHGEPGEALRRRLARIPRFFSTDNSLHRYLDEILETYASPEPHKALMIHALLAVFFAKLLAFSERSLERNLSPGVKAAVLHVKKNLTRPLTVSDLAS
ncbi:MAG: AraC family ligand binding domain-containing protein, partial [Spirochaetia bacterium]|nr:AraC family ligand binding domain-containing protein [Spirochaetia bacterium]